MDEKMWKKHFAGDEFGTIGELDKFLDDLTKDQPAINILANAVRNAEVYLDQEFEGEGKEISFGGFTVYTLWNLIMFAMRKLEQAEDLTGLSQDGIRILEGNTDEDEETDKE